MSKRTVATFKDHEAKKPTKLKCVPPTMPVEPALRHCACISTPGQPDIVLEQRIAGGKQFRLTVGPVVHDGLTYKQAARILGTYMMLNLEAANRLDGDCA